MPHELQDIVARHYIINELERERQTKVRYTVIGIGLSREGTLETALTMLLIVEGVGDAGTGVKTQV